MELNEKDPDEKSMIDMQIDQMKMMVQQQKNKPTGRSGQGRPLNSKDSEKRKKRTVLPNSKADSDEFVNLTLYANQIQRLIHEEITPFFLDKFGKSNMRQLTQSEEKELDDFRHVLLYTIPPDQVPSDSLIHAALSSSMTPDVNGFMLYNRLLSDFRSVKSKEPTYEDIKQLRNFVYACIKGNYFDSKEGVE